MKLGNVVHGGWIKNWIRASKQWERFAILVFEDPMKILDRLSSASPNALVNLDTPTSPHPLPISWCQNDANESMVKLTMWLDASNYDLLVACTYSQIKRIICVL